MGEAQKCLRYKAHVDLPHKIGICKRIVTSRVDLIVVAQLMQRLGLEQLADRQLPVPGNNRGYRQGAMFNIFMLLFHEGGRCLDDVGHLEKEKPLMKLLGCGKLPGARHWAIDCGASGAVVRRCKDWSISTKQFLRQGFTTERRLPWK